MQTNILTIVNSFYVHDKIVDNILVSRNIKGIDSTRNDLFLQLLTVYIAFCVIKTV